MPMPSLPSMIFIRMTPEHGRVLRDKAGARWLNLLVKRFWSRCLARVLKPGAWSALIFDAKTASIFIPPKKSEILVAKLSYWATGQAKPGRHKKAASSWQLADGNELL